MKPIEDYSTSEILEAIFGVLFFCSIIYGIFYLMKWEAERQDKEELAQREFCAKNSLEVHKTPIVSIERNMASSGGVRGGGLFVLGFGVGGMKGESNDNFRYYYYKNTDNGGFVLDSIPATTEIIETNEEKPHIKNTITRKWEETGIYNGCDTQYVKQLIVPKNTITKDFQL